MARGALKDRVETMKDIILSHPYLAFFALAMIVGNARAMLIGRGQR